jgi:hypothetical protein
MHGYVSTAGSPAGTRTRVARVSLQTPSLTVGTENRLQRRACLLADRVVFQQAVKSGASSRPNPERLGL